MSHGVRAYAANGSIRVDTDTLLTRLIYTQELTANDAGSVAPSGFDGSVGEAFAVKRDVSNLNACAHKVSISGNTIYYQPSSSWTQLRSASLLVAVHYK